METAHPISEFHLEDTTFSVYRAKAFHSDEWESAVIREQVAAARESYRIYSPTIPAFDAYDAKSAVYAVCARYPIEYQGEIAVLSEWTTIRFVPASGSPALSEDLKQYQITSANSSSNVLDQICERVLQSTTAECLDRVFTYSRISVSRPMADDIAKQWLVNAYWQASGIRTKNRWTAVAFALMSSAFLADLKNLKAQSSIAVTAQINQKVEQTVFLPALQQIGVVDKVPFPFAYQVLGLSSPKAIHLNRTDFNHYFYSFPGYFFSVPELIVALQELVTHDEIAVSTLEQYVDAPWSSVVDEPSYAQLHRLGELLTTSGSIPDSALTGEELREYLDSRVSDGVQLRLLTQELIEKRCDQLLSSHAKKEKHNERSF